MSHLENPLTKGQYREFVKPGVVVGIIRGQDRETGRMTFAQVVKVLTQEHHCPHGIKVQLETGDRGHVIEVCDQWHKPPQRRGEKK